jgi:hypothetical protein
LFLRTTVIASVPNRGRSPEPKAKQNPQPIADIFDIVPLLRELRLEVSVCSENATQKPVIAFNKYRARRIKDIGNVVQSAGRLKKLVILLDWVSKWSTKPWIAAGRGSVKGFSRVVSIGGRLRMVKVMTEADGLSSS